MSDPAGRAAEPSRTSSGTPTLDYSTPRVFFSGAYRFRSWNAIFGVALLLALTIVTAVAAFRFDGPGRLSLPVFGLLSAGFFVGAIWVAWLVINGHEETVRVTEDGIERDGQLLPWQTISYFGGVGSLDRVMLECHVGRGRMRTVELLQTTPSLTGKHYDALIKVLSAYLDSEFPHVEVGEDPYKLRD